MTKKKYIVTSKINQGISERFNSKQGAIEYAKKICEKIGHASVGSLNAHKAIWDCTNDNTLSKNKKEENPIIKKNKEKMKWFLEKKFLPKIKTIRYWFKNKQNPDNFYDNIPEMEKEIDQWFKEYPNGCFSKIYDNKERFLKETKLAREKAFQIIQNHFF